MIFCEQMSKHLHGLTLWTCTVCITGLKKPHVPRTGRHHIRWSTNVRCGIWGIQIVRSIFIWWNFNGQSLHARSTKHGMWFVWSAAFLKYMPCVLLILRLVLDQGKDQHNRAKFTDWSEAEHNPCMLHSYTCYAPKCQDSILSHIQVCIATIGEHFEQYL